MNVTSGVIFLAAGSSQRFGSSTPKQFLRLSNEPLFMRSFRLFVKHRGVSEIVFVTKRVHFNFVRSWINRVRTSKEVSIVEGGDFRGESVKNGMLSLKTKTDVVLVHDSARPLVSSKIISGVAVASYKTGAALAAWPLPDTLKKGKGQLVERTIPRKDLWLAQTPQGFRFALAKKYLLHPSRTATDDVELAQRKGQKVALVLGSPINMKVTYPSDLSLCQKLI